MFAGADQPPPSKRLNIAGIGVGGQGAGVLRRLAELGQNIVALCDVDTQHAAGTFRAYPQAEVFQDYRVLLDRSRNIDAVMIATPDQTHAPATLAALRGGKHVYVEKPMSHSIEEARVMTQVAKQIGVVTQVGNQGHAGEGLRLTREWIQAGLIGAVREVHCWSDRPGRFWSQNIDRPTETPPVPDTLDWNLWLGGAPERPYHPVYCPRAWRGWFDFGTGAMGDMAVHNMDPAFYALDLDAPIRAEARTSQPLMAESCPTWSVITYHFAARGDQPEVTVTWHDGGQAKSEKDRHFSLAIRDLGRPLKQTALPKCRTKSSASRHLPQTLLTRRDSALSENTEKCLSFSSFSSISSTTFFGKGEGQTRFFSPDGRRDEAG